MNYQVKFDKYHGCGNDFVIISNLDQKYPDLAQSSRKILDRHFGIGADQLLLILPSHKYDFKVVIYNSDGSQAGMCGNGMRCVAHFLRHYEIISAQKSEVSFEVGDRLISCFFKHPSNLITVDMRAPIFEASEIPCLAEGKIENFPLKIPDHNFMIQALSMGNPHCVIFCEKVAAIDLLKIGPLIEHHAFFPQRTNVEFVEVISPSILKVAVWERGAGATLACGSGACAALVAAARAGVAERAATVKLPGGSLEVRWSQENNHVLLSGPATRVASGFLAEELLDPSCNQALSEL